MSAEEVPNTFSTLLEQEQSGELSPVSDARYVGTENIAGCRVSTTVSDVRYGRYVDGTVSHKACVVILKFGFAGDWSKRMKMIRISLSFSASQPGSAPSDVDASNHVVPELRFYKPSSGNSQETSRRTTLARSGSASLGMNSGTTIGGGLSRSTEIERITSARLTSIQEAKNTVSWDLSEDSQKKQGIPPELNCVIVIQTDDVAFTASVKFMTKIKGQLAQFTGSKTSFISSSHLQNRQSSLPAEEEGLFDDMDSDKFTEWVKKKAYNSWIVMS